MRARWTVGVLLGTVACGSLTPERARFLDDLVATEAAEGQRRWDEAEAGARRLLPVADRLQERCSLLLVLARVSAGRKQALEAIERYGAVGRECGADPMTSAQALFETGRVVAESDPDPLKALPVFEKVVRTFPDEPAARRALLWGRDLLLERRDREAAIRWLRERHRDAGRKTRAAGYALFEGAMLVKDRPPAAGAEDPRVEALALFDLLAREQPEGTLFDDARLQAARLFLALGQPARAQERLKSILDRRETSWYFGSYDLPTYPEASFLVAQATWMETRDVNRAVAAYDRFLRDFGGGMLGARALHECWRLLTEAGRPAEARRYLERLAAMEPSTRMSRWAKRRLGGETDRPAPLPRAEF